MDDENLEVPSAFFDSDGAFIVTADSPFYPDEFNEYDEMQFEVACMTQSRQIPASDVAGRLSTEQLLKANYDFTRGRPNITVVEESNQTKWYDVKKPVCTDLLDPSKLPQAFEALNVKWGPKNEAEDRLRTFLGNPSEETMKELSKPFDIKSIRSRMALSPMENSETTLHTSKRANIRSLQLGHSTHKRWVKYGSNFTVKAKVPSKYHPPSNLDTNSGENLLYSIRTYIPFFNGRKGIDRLPRCSREFVLKGHHTLYDIRSNMLCLNDCGMIQDSSADPNKEESIDPNQYPSGFFFINNVFYNDMRSPQAKDLSEVIQRWAITNGIGNFQSKDMAGIRLVDLKIKLGHPELYMHQGSCEHLLTFSSVHLVEINEIPFMHCTTPRHHLHKCMTCSNNPAAWVVTQCARLPQERTSFCRRCFFMYMYKDDKKIGDFKAYRFSQEDISVGKV